MIARADNTNEANRLLKKLSVENKIIKVIPKFSVTEFNGATYEHEKVYIIYEDKRVIHLEEIE